MKQIRKVIANNWFSIMLLVRHIPLYVLFSICLFIMKGMLQSLSNVWLVEKVIDGVTTVDFHTAILHPLFLVCLFAAFTGLFGAFFSELAEKVYIQRFSEKMRLILYKKAIDCDVCKYDDADFYNDYIWATSECDTRTFKSFQTVLAFIQRITVITSAMVMMTKISKIILTVVLISCVVNFYLSIKRNHAQFELQNQLKPLSKITSYVGRVIHSPEYAKEMRTSRIAKVLLGMYHNAVDHMSMVTKEKSKILFKYDFAKKVLGEEIFVTFFTIVVLAFQARCGAISIGALVASYKGMQVIHTSFSFLLERAAAFSENSFYVDKLKKFWSYEPDIALSSGETIPETTVSIGVQNLSFAYGEADRKILKNVSFDCRYPKKIAIVGSNGVGKSTLVKLILRLYDAVDGKVLHNGVDIRRLDLKSYRNKYSCLFQDFNLYACSIGENIAMKPKGELDLQRAKEVMADSGFYEKFETFAKRENAIVTKEFDENGILLSGGEKQKLAIARVLYQFADCYILDEPTAALDPVAEAEFNKTVMNCLDGKMIIIISHRLTTTRYVDEIIVLENGGICEIGSHEELMDKNGKYAKLFNLQASQYLNI